jgi:hypothetical protein
MRLLRLVLLLSVISALSYAQRGGGGGFRVGLRDVASVADLSAAGSVVASQTAASAISGSLVALSSRATGSSSASVSDYPFPSMSTRTIQLHVDTPITGPTDPPMMLTPTAIQPRRQAWAADRPLLKRESHR